MPIFPRICLVVWSLGGAWLAAEEAPARVAPASWLGIEVSKPDPTTVAQLPSLPSGMGFVVRHVDPDGPAALAGVREFDIVWALGDQMLVNEGQLAALLRLHKPGEQLRLAAFRGGQPLELAIKLGEMPATHTALPTGMLEATLLPDSFGGATRVVNLHDKVASLTAEDGRVEIWREGATYYVKLHGPEDELLFNNPMRPDGSLAGIPPVWHARVNALRRCLDQALAGQIAPSRPPRPRIVRPPATTP